MRPAVLVLALSLVSCAAPRPYRADPGLPEVRRFDAGGLEVRLGLAVRGGEAAARVRGIDWEVLLGGLPVGIGTSGIEAVVPPGGETLLELPLALRLGADLPAGVRPALARGGSVPVVVRGVVRLRDREGDAVRLPFSAATRARLAPGAVIAPASDASDSSDDELP